jgi:hypothetical protein
VPLVELERITDELTGFAAGLPERYRYSVMSALRQACEAGVRYGYMTRNPAKLAGANPQPKPRGPCECLRRRSSIASRRNSAIEVPRHSASRQRQVFVLRNGPMLRGGTSTVRAAC